MSKSKATQSGIIGVMVCVVVLAFLQQTNVIAIPVISGVMATFVPLGWDPATVAWYITICNVGCVFGPIIYSAIANKVPTKFVIIVAAAVIVVFGSAPAFLGSDFIVILATRFILGFGVGIIFSASPVLINANMDEKTGARWMGFVQVFASIGMVVYQTATGFIGVIDWHLSMLLHAASLLIILVVLLALRSDRDPGSKKFVAPEGAVDAQTAIKEGGDKLTFAQRFPLQVVIYWLFIFISVSGIYLLQVELSTLAPTLPVLASDPAVLATTADVGLILSVHTITGLFAALVFGLVFNKIHEWVMVCGAVIAVFALACCYLATDMILLYVGAGLLGIAAPCLVAACFQLAGRNAAPTAAAMAVSIAVAAQNLGVIAEPLWTKPILGALGLDANGGRDPFILGVVLFIAMIVLAAINAVAAGRKNKKLRRGENNA
jgi:MFS family permease